MSSDFSVCYKVVAVNPKNMLQIILALSTSAHKFIPVLKSNTFKHYWSDNLNLKLNLFKLIMYGKAVASPQQAGLTRLDCTVSTNTS